MPSVRPITKNGQETCTGTRVKETSIGYQRVKQSGEKDGTRDSQREDMLHISQKDMEKEMEGNKEREKVRGSVAIVGSQDIGRESAQNPKGSSMHVVIVVRKAIKQRNASHLKDGAKERDSTK